MGHSQPRNFQRISDISRASYLDVGVISHRQFAVHLESRDPEVHRKKPLIFPFSCLRTGREQHVPDSSNHSPCLINLFNSRHMTQRHKKKRR